MKAPFSGVSLEKRNRVLECGFAHISDKVSISFYMNYRDAPLEKEGHTYPPGFDIMADYLEYENDVLCTRTHWLSFISSEDYKTSILEGISQGLTKDTAIDSVAQGFRVKLPLAIRALWQGFNLSYDKS